jgi:hypothetical protein
VRRFWEEGGRDCTEICSSSFALRALRRSGRSVCVSLAVGQRKQEDGFSSFSPLSSLFPLHTRLRPAVPSCCALLWRYSDPPTSPLLSSSRLKSGNSRTSSLLPFLLPPFFSPFPSLGTLSEMDGGYFAYHQWQRQQQKHSRPSTPQPRTSFPPLSFSFFLTNTTSRRNRIPLIRIYPP